MMGFCKDCMYWREVVGQSNMKFCLCNPPQVILIPRQSALRPEQMSLSAEGAWPPVGPDHQCGKWEKRVEEASDDTSSNIGKLLSIEDRMRPDRRD